MDLIFTPDDELLIRECIDGNRKSQKKLYELYAPALYRLCFNYAKNTELAEDILQEVFIKLYNNLHKYRGDGPFAAWMRRITINTAIECIRKHKRASFFAIDEEAQFTCQHATALDILYAKDVIKQTYSLSAGYREVFNLYVVEGFSHKEIAKRFDITESTSKSQFCRAKSLLRKMVTEQS